MSINATITELTPEEVAEIEVELVEQLIDVFPNLDLNRGKVLRDLLIRPAAVGLALMSRNVEKLRQNMTLDAISADPTVADEDAVDALLSNFLLERGAATTAAGLVTIVINSLTTTSVPSDTIFTDAAGNVFRTNANFTAVTSESLVFSNLDRLLIARADGRYTFTVPVVAETAGYKPVSKNARLVTSLNLTRIFDVYAEADFLPGRDAETNADLIARLAQGITAQVISGRQHIESLLTTNFPGIQDMSLIGFGDGEMVRDKHNIFSISQGGKSDIYTRTAILPLSTTLELDAVLHNRNAQHWRINLGRDVLPGFYDIVSILPTPRKDDGGTLEVISFIRGVDTTKNTPNHFIPLLEDTHEGAFSAFQTAEIIFQDLSSAVASMTENVSTQSYTVVLRAMPDIKTIQEFVSDRSRRVEDYLVRAPIPVFVNADIVVERSDGLDIDVGPLQEAAANIVNSLKFEDGRLPVSIIIDAIQELLPSQVWIKLPIMVFGTVIQPDGITKHIRSSSTLVVTEELDVSVSGRTTSFFMRKEDVAITVVDRFVRDVI